MRTGILIIAHQPLASALRTCMLHVYPDATDSVQALDVVADEPPPQSVQRARQLAERMQEKTQAPNVLILTDVYGATPSNVARTLATEKGWRLVAGVNLPMLLRTVNYLHEDIDALVERAVCGGAQCILEIAAPGA